MLEIVLDIKMTVSPDVKKVDLLATGITTIFAARDESGLLK